MLFIYPMWDNESQRIGKQKCTPKGYNLHVIAELLGFIGLLVVSVTSDNRRPFSRTRAL